MRIHLFKPEEAAASISHHTVADRRLALRPARRALQQLRRDLAQTEEAEQPAHQVDEADQKVLDALPQRGSVAPGGHAGEKQGGEWCV